MWRSVARIRRNMHNLRKSPRVADESMFGGMNINNGTEFPIIFARETAGRQRIGFSAIFRIVLAPFSLLSCFSSQPHANGVDGLWVSGRHEFAQISEMNHLMVNDSMRYAILM
ncbi:hypothetical protein JCGZ_13803 [Jatropha curcas]|uniref:Uncharacterized protein n=1 Tax=Jatropha curcas TaxID=180498 RepID=A0A067KF26_JATCU|nr:uncharacterized protein LOC105640903 [Jatropha curcas]KDP30860.1 hypothetical protein JCGZ_13803 [Jatropha curcas]